jgi:5-formyltetrahydrofolate cyclo-ligase
MHCCQHEWYAWGTGSYFDRPNLSWGEIGVLIEACLTNEAFQEEFDVPLDVLVTEKRIIEITKKG